VYYGNPSAGSPPTTTPSSRRFLAQSMGYSSTTSTTYSQKVQLDFTPTDTSEQWVIVATWRQEHVGDAGTQQDLGRARIRINGTTRTGNNNISYRMSGNAWQAFAVVFKITGEDTTQQVELDFRADGGEDAIDKAQIMAFMIPDPANADIQYAETLSPTTDTFNPTVAQTLNFSPTSGGDYIWMANGFLHEAPGGATNGGMYLVDETGTDQQDSQESYIDGSNVIVVPITHFEQRALTTGSKTFSFRHQPDDTSGGSERMGLTQLLFRSDVFDSVETDDSPGQSTTGSQSYVNKASLTTAAVGGGEYRDYIYLAVMMHDDTGAGTIDSGEWAEIQIDGGQATEANKPMDRSSYDTQIVWAYGEYSPGGSTIDANYAADNGLTAEAQYAHILALRYKEPSTSVGSEETP
jgi:hypothetical protein